MSQLNYTPGPWKAVPRSTDALEEDYFLGWEIEGPPEAMRGQFSRGDDARLAAAAPDLYQALQAIKARLDAPVDNPEEFCRAFLDVGQIVDEALNAVEGGE